MALIDFRKRWLSPKIRLNEYTLMQLNNKLNFKWQKTKTLKKTVAARCEQVIFHYKLW